MTDLKKGVRLIPPSRTVYMNLYGDEKAGHGFYYNTVAAAVSSADLHRSDVVAAAVPVVIEQCTETY